MPLSRPGGGCGTQRCSPQAARGMLRASAVPAANGAAPPCSHRCVPAGLREDTAPQLLYQPVSIAWKCADLLRNVLVQIMHCDVTR